MPYVKIGESRKIPFKLYYETLGDEDATEKVLLIMGFRCNMFAWDRQILFFKNHPEYHVCIFDNRGCGKSADEGKYSTTILAQDALELARDHLGWSAVHLVGQSMGGMIAQELVLRHPTFIKSLVLGSTHAGGWRGLVPLAGFKKMYAVVSKKTVSDKVKSILNMTYSQSFLTGSHLLNTTSTSTSTSSSSDVDDNDSDATIAHTCNEDVMVQRYKLREKHTPKQSMRGVWGHVKCVATHYVSNRRLRKIGKLNIPKLIIHGTDDQLIGHNNAQLIHKQIGGKLMIFEGCGHCANGEMEHSYNAAILQNMRSADNFIDKLARTNNDFVFL